MFQVNPLPMNPLLGRGFTWKNQALFSSKDKSKKLKCHLLQFLARLGEVQEELLYYLGVGVAISVGGDIGVSKMLKFLS